MACKADLAALEAPLGYPACLSGSGLNIQIDALLVEPSSVLVTHTWTVMLPILESVLPPKRPHF